MSSDAGKAMKRDHDSVDDFEHLEHDGAPTTRDAGRESAVDEHQLAAPGDAPRVDGLLDIIRTLEGGLASRAFTDEAEHRKSVPATPPPSANFEKPEATAQSSEPFQRVQSDSFDAKAATVAFMETERTFAPVHQEPAAGAAHGEHRVLAAFDGAFDAAFAKRDEELAGPEAAVDDAKPDDAPAIDRSKDARSDPREKPRPDVDLLGDDDHKIAASTAPPALSTTEVEPGLEAAKKSDGGELEEQRAKWKDDDFLGEIKSFVLPGPEKSPTVDFLGDLAAAKEERGRNIMDDDSWNVVERPGNAREVVAVEPPAKPLPPLPRDADLDSDKGSNVDKFEMSNDFVVAEVAKSGKPQQQPAAEVADLEFENAAGPTPAKGATQAARQDAKRPSENVCSYRRPASKVEEIEIAPKEIFRDMGLDAWFNPERLNPKVAALIYWRNTQKTGIVFGAILVVLLSLAYFSLISVFAYFSLLALTGTIIFRIYKTILQAIQKTSDGHPFKDILDLDLTLPAEKVHEVADVAVAHANAAVSELRRLFLVEDFVDSLKFAVLLWCLTYVGSWFNGMTLIIIGVVALFTLPKVYETNKAQIDQNLVLVQGKVNEITAKLKAAIPLGKKPEPTKEE